MFYNFRLPTIIIAAYLSSYIILYRIATVYKIERFIYLSYSYSPPRYPYLNLSIFIDALFLVYSARPYLLLTLSIYITTLRYRSISDLAVSIEVIIVVTTTIL